MKRRFLPILLVMLVTSGCLPPHRVERKLARVDDAATLDRRSPFLKAHLRDGSLLVLQDWRLPRDSNVVTGRGARLGINRDTVANGPLAVSLDSVLLFETNVLTSPGPKTPLTILSVLTAGVGLICAANPKSCFGSCPTFYAGSDARILAEGFSASIAPPLEASDIDRLEIAPVKQRTFDLRMTNEALETHVVRSLHLLAFPRVAKTQVLYAGAEFWRTGELIAPACTAAEGDCTHHVARLDGVERYSLADSTDLAARELVDLRFDVPAAGEYALALSSRQTLLHTYVFYQTLAFMGTRAGEWLAALGRGDMTVMAGVYALGRTMGGIEIGRPGRSDDYATTVYETGPLALDTHLVPLGTLARGSHTLRLRLARGHWRIDRLAITPMIAREQPVRLAPSRVTRDGRADPDALEKLTGSSQPLSTLPGDEYRLRFELPPSRDGLELFLESRGYYLEWLRTEWLAEENTEHARMMLFEPARGLREIAPAFKQWEPRMEELFWNSRYARP